MRTLPTLGPYGCATDSITLDRALMKIKRTGPVCIPLCAPWWLRALRWLMGER